MPLATIDDEFEMCDGISWTATGPRGKVWSIVWQPSRTENNMRAWPFPGGRTAHYAHATTKEEARKKALNIAEKIRNGVR